MSIFNTLCKAIDTRQHERQSDGYPAMKEMEITQEMRNDLVAELTTGPMSLFFIRDPTITETKIMGVTIKVIGE